MPTTTTNFDDFLWAERIGAGDPDAVMDVYTVTEGGGGESGAYRSDVISGGLLVHGWSETQLLLTSDNARQGFRRLLEGFATREGFGGDVDSWAGYRAAIAAPNS